jgi:hypothetical protein
VPVSWNVWTVIGSIWPALEAIISVRFSFPFIAKITIQNISYLGPRTQGCVLASSANSSAVPMCQDLIPAPTGLSPVSGQSPPESVHLLPLYSPNDTLLISTGIGPGAGPLPELGDKEIRQNYVQF